MKDRWKKANVSTHFLNKCVLTLTSIKNIIKNSKNEIFWKIIILLIYNFGLINIILKIFVKKFSIVYYRIKELIGFVDPYTMIERKLFFLNQQNLLIEHNSEYKLYIQIHEKNSKTHTSRVKKLKDFSKKKTKELPTQNK
jgi:hypothetical protein